jgi:hypothetical protein
VRRGRGGTAWFRDRGVRTKILLLLALLGVVIAATGTYAALSLRDLAERTAQVETVSHDVSAPLAVVHQEEIKARMLIAQAGASATDDPAAQQEFLDKTSRPPPRRSRPGWAPSRSSRGRTSAPPGTPGRRSATTSSSRRPSTPTRRCSGRSATTSRSR